MDTILPLVLIGLCAGILSGLFGIGGGVIIVPALIYLLGFSQHRATGTSLVVLLPPVGIGAVMEYARHGAVDWKAAIIVAVMVFVGATLGATFANKMDVATLKILFSLFLIGLGCSLLIGSLRSHHENQSSNQPSHSARLSRAQPVGVGSGREIHVRYENVG